MDLVYIVWILFEFDNYYIKIVCIIVFESINVLVLMLKFFCKIIKSGVFVKLFYRRLVIMYR